MVGRLITEDILPSLKEWFEYNAGAGCSPAQLKDTLVEAGYRPTDVQRFLDDEAALWSRRQAGGPYDADPVGSEGEAVARFWSRADMLYSLNEVFLGDRTVRIAAKDPRHGIYFVSGFLSEDECDSLVDYSAKRLTDSKIVDESDGSETRTHTRSSRGAAIPRGATELARRIESRIAKLTALPVGLGEGLQILHYGIGGEYLPHFDYFDPETVGGKKVLARNSQRIASLIMYLSDVESGGGTLFPELSLQFTPAKGAALLFASLGRDGAVQESSLHAGLPVTSGDKWIATKWLRLTPQD
jgi:prolyl 4-hydroxylase